MINSRIKLKHALFIVSIVLFLTITIPILLNHFPWSDEAYPWLIARELNIFEIFNLMRIEGHFFLWYLILMPFAKADFFYPYTMQFLNLGFLILAIFVMWKYAPFNPFVKSFITLSFPFLNVYSRYSRCYTLGFLFLFLISALYKNRMKYPVLYSTMILFALNTSVMAFIGASIFGIHFIYEYFTKKEIPFKNKRGVLIVVIIAAILFLIQVLGGTMPEYGLYGSLSDHFANFFELIFPLTIQTQITSLLYFVLLIGSFYFFKRKNMLPILLTLLPFILIFYFFVIYSAARNSHFYFVYYYLIMAVWIFLYENKIETKFQKIYYSIFVTFCFSLILGFSGETHEGNARMYEHFRDNIETYKNYKIFFYPKNAYVQKEIAPFFKRGVLKCYDIYGFNMASFSHFYEHWHDQKGLNFNAVIEQILKGKTNTAYLVCNSRLSPHALEKEYPVNVELIYADRIGYRFLYKITVKI